MHDVYDTSFFIYLLLSLKVGEVNCTHYQLQIFSLQLMGPGMSNKSSSRLVNKLVITKIYKTQVSENLVPL